MFGSWFDHVRSWLNAEDKHRILYISYEELKMVSCVFVVVVFFKFSHSVEITVYEIMCLFGFLLSYRI